ncbi:pentapeptide repeat-containing protein [Synechococcus sp. H55.7]|uniref:pentapeptide repeat-containing protein n=1 Tax=unclassified Synechococcus TaxID=2626047 RepID=UPI0039C13EE9
MNYSVGDLVRDYAAGRRDFQEIELPQADLEGIHLAGADLRYADFSGANLAGANLRGCDLSFADCSGANLSGADLRGCLLFGSNFRGALLEGALLDHADCDAYTHFPAGFDPKAHRLHNLSAEVSQ